VAPQRTVDILTVAGTAFGLVSVVALLVAVSLGHDASKSTAASARVLVWTFVLNALTTILLVFYILIRYLRVRKATERNGEPLLTRRGSLHVNASPPEVLYWAKVALRSVDTYNVSVDPQRLQITAQARAKLEQGRTSTHSGSPADRGWFGPLSPRGQMPSWQRTTSERIGRTLGSSYMRRCSGSHVNSGIAVGTMSNLWVRPAGATHGPIPGPFPVFAQSR
jgi:hypothetical protein